MEAGRIYKICFDPRNYNDISTWGDFCAKIKQKFNEELDLEMPFPMPESSGDIYIQFPGWTLKGNDNSRQSFLICGDYDGYPTHDASETFSDSTFYLIKGLSGGGRIDGRDIEANQFYLNGIPDGPGDAYTHPTTSAYFFLIDTTLWREDCKIILYSWCRFKTSNPVTEWRDDLFFCSPFVSCEAKYDDTGETGDALFNFGMSRNVQYGISGNHIAGGTIPNKTKTQGTTVKPNIQLQKLRLDGFTFGGENIYWTYDCDNAFISATQFYENIKNVTKYHYDVKAGDVTYKIPLNWRNFTQSSSVGYPVLAIKQ